MTSDTTRNTPLLSEALMPCCLLDFSLESIPVTRL